MRSELSKRKRRRIALPALGAAGASLIMGNGASATAPTATSLQDTLLRPVVTLDEEEVADVSLGTFYVFDKENESRLGQGIRLAAAPVAVEAAAGAEAAQQPGAEAAQAGAQ
jgi:hypothetical protein